MSIFDETPSNIVTIEDGKDYVSELVGDDKKFKSVSDLARGKLEADNYINTLTSRLDELRKELDSRTSLDQFLTEMKGLKAPVQNEQVQPSTPAQVPAGSLDDSVLEEKLAALLERRRAQERSESNLDQVQRVLSETYGDQASSVINKKAKDLGMSVKDLQALATNSPQAFYQLVGVQERNPVQSLAPRSTLNSLSTPNNLGVKNKAYFDKMKKENPRAYHDPKTTNEMVRAMQECQDKRIPWE